MEKNLEEIKGDQKQHGEELRNHKAQLETHGAFLEQVWKKDLEDD